MYHEGGLYLIVLLRNECQCNYSILFYPIPLEGRWGTTDEFAAIPFHLVLFPAALVELAKSIPIHSLKLSSQVFYCQRGWSGGAMVQGKLPVPGRPTYLE